MVSPSTLQVERWVTPCASSGPDQRQSKLKEAPHLNFHSLVESSIGVVPSFGITFYLVCLYGLTE